MPYIVETKTYATAKWRPVQSRVKYSSEADAETAIRSWDQDGDFNRRAFRIVEVR